MKNITLTSDKRHFSFTPRFSVSYRFGYAHRIIFSLRHELKCLLADQ